MEFNKKEWTGNWVNFEKYIYSTEAAMQQCWAEADEAAKAMPMFKRGVKSFWKMACNTIAPGNPVRLGGWKVSDSGDGIEIEWLDEKGTSLGSSVYACREIIARGLEGKENYLLEAREVSDNWPFRYVLAMEPMPSREDKATGSLLSHFHFQYAGSRKNLLKEDGTLADPMWYGTMCDGEGTLLDECNIVRALHKMKTWEKLPE